MCRLFPHRAVQEYLPIHIFPTIHAAPTNYVFASFTRTEQVRINLDHHSVATNAPVPLFHHESPVPQHLVTCKRLV